MPGPGRKELRSLRLKAEDTNGVAVAPRFLWRGQGEMAQDSREVTFVDEQIGIFGGSDRTYIAKYLAEISLAETPATFEQLPDLFMLTGFGTAIGSRAGSAQGANGSAVGFTLPVPTSTAPQTQSYSLEAGDDAEAEVVEYVLGDELTLSFAGGEAMMMSGKLSGRQVQLTNAVGSFSNAGTLPAVESILAGRGTFWLTPIGSSFGTGQVTAGNILAGKISFKPRWTRKFPVDNGQLYFHTAVFTGIDIDGELTMEHQTTGTYGAAGSAGQKFKWRNEVPQLLRCRWTGGTLSNGTTYQAKTLQIDLPIKWQSFDALGDMDGNDIAVGKFLSRYNELTPSAGRGTVLIVRQGTSEFAGA